RHVKVLPQVELVEDQVERFSRRRGRDRLPPAGGITGAYQLERAGDGLDAFGGEAAVHVVLLPADTFHELRVGVTAEQVVEGIDVGHAENPVEQLPREVDVELGRSDLAPRLVVQVARVDQHAVHVPDDCAVWSGHVSSWLGTIRIHSRPFYHLYRRGNQQLMDSSRRSFLKSAGLLSAGLLVQGFDVPLPVGPRRKQNDDITHWDGSKLGRMQLNVTTVYAEPTWRSAHKGWYYYDDVVPIKQAVVGVGLYPSNSTWLEIDGGYIYSSWVQPVSEEPPNPVERIGPRGAWGVVTVPKTESRSGPGDEHFRREIMVYGTVHQIIEEQNGYYLGEGVYGGKYWLNAKDVR